jgi:hypothetical protein
MANLTQDQKSQSCTANFDADQHVEMIRKSRVVNKNILADGNFQALFGHHRNAKLSPEPQIKLKQREITTHITESHVCCVISDVHAPFFASIL